MAVHAHVDWCAPFTFTIATEKQWGPVSIMRNRRYGPFVAGCTCNWSRLHVRARTWSPQLKSTTHEHQIFVPLPYSLSITFRLRRSAWHGSGHREASSRNRVPEAADGYKMGRLLRRLRHNLFIQPLPAVACNSWRRDECLCACTLRAKLAAVRSKYTASCVCHVFRILANACGAHAPSPRRRRDVPAQSVTAHPGNAVTELSHDRQLPYRNTLFLGEALGGMYDLPVFMAVRSSGCTLARTQALVLSAD